MKSKSFFFLLWIVSQSISAQSVINDAIKLGESPLVEDRDGRLVISDNTDYYKILENYTGHPKDSDGMKDSLLNNPFIRLNDNAKRQFNDEPGNSSSSFIGNIPVTNIALGMADFLVERTKTELNTAFFRRFKEELNCERYKDLKSLFPTTSRLLNAIDTDIYQFDHYLNALRQAFDEDLRSILDHLPAVIENHHNEPFFVGRPELEHSLYFALNIAQWVKSEKNPGEILALSALNEHLGYLAVSKKVAYRNAANSIRLVSLISESLRSNDSTSGYWADVSQLAHLRKEQIFRIYLGLLYQQCKKEPYDKITLPFLISNNTISQMPNETTLQGQLELIGGEWKKNSNIIRFYQDFILDIGKRTQSLMQATNALTTAQNNIINNTNMANKAKQQKLFDLSLDVFHQMVSLIELSTTVDKLPYIKIEVSDELKEIVSQLKLVGSIAVHINQKQYAGAVSKLVILMETFLLEEEKDKNRYFYAGLIDSTDISKTKDKIALYREIEVLRKERDQLKTLPRYKGKKQQIRGINKQVILLEKRAALIKVNPQIADTTALNNKKKELLVLERSKSGKEKQLIDEQISAINQQIKGVMALGATLPPTASNDKILRKILKYGTFMANIVESETPEEAKKAIEAVALPPGSYSVKRHSKCNVALNGYLGMFGGWEYMRVEESNSTFNNLGITAPVGLSFSWGNIGSKKIRPWCVGFSVPLIDLGAVASYSFNKDNTVETVPTIQLKHLAAPGLFFEVGIGGTPLTFGVGGQIGPRLRGIRNTTNEVGDFYYRLGATIKVDIPILNFYANPGKR